MSIIRPIKTGATRHLGAAGVRRLLAQHYRGEYAAVAEDWKPKKGFLYSQVRAITARINQNYDAWPSVELKKSYRSFLGKPCFVNHKNEDPKKARGKVIAARYVEAGDDRYIETIMEIDAVRFPKLAAEIVEGGLDSVSMGVECAVTTCSHCGNRATDEPEFCEHVAYRKGEKLFNPRTGRVEPVHEVCEKLGFFELSYVFDPADETAVVSRVIAAGRQAGRHDSDNPRSDEDQYREWAREHHAPPDDWGAFFEHMYTPGRHEADKKGPADWGEWYEQYGQHQGEEPPPLSEMEVRELFRIGPGHGKTANSLHHTDWADVGRRAYDQGDPPEPHRNREVAKATRHLPQHSPEVHEVHEAYHRGYETAQRAASPRVAPQQHQEAVGLGGYPGGHQWHQKHKTAKPFPHDEEWHRRNPHYDEDTGKGWLSDPGSYHTPKEMEWYEEQKRRGAVQRRAYGETEAPEDIDTMRRERGDALGDFDFVAPIEDEDDVPFQQVIESPKELQAPDLSRTKQLDRQQEEEGLDTDRRVEDVEAVDPEGDPALVAPERAETRRRPMARRYRYADDDRPPWLRDDEAEDDDNDSRDEDGGYDDSDDGGQAGGGWDEGGDGGDDIDDEAEGQDEGEEDEEDQAAGGESDDELFDEAEQDIERARGAFEGEQEDDGDGDVQLHLHHHVHEQPQPDSGGGQVPPQFLESRRRRAKNTKGKGTKSKEARRMSGLTERVVTASRHTKAPRQHFADSDGSGNTEGSPYGRNDEGENEPVYVTPTPGSEAVEAPDDGESKIRNTPDNLVASLQQRIRQRSAQLERDIVAYRTLTGSDDDSDDDDEKDEKDEKDDDKKDDDDDDKKFPWDKESRRRYAAEATDDSRVLDPPMSGTNEDLGGASPEHEFTDLELSGEGTQPKDASVKAFAAFDDWLKTTTGRSAARHHPNFVRREAARFAQASGVPLGAMFPALEVFLRRARRAEANRRGSMNRRAGEGVADEKLEVAAPDARVDVTAPTSETTDTRAQQSQYALDEYGQNAGDDKAKPDLSTDSQIWAPGEGGGTSSRESSWNRKADAVAAVRYAEAHISAGLPYEDKWQLVAQAQTMRHATVVDRTRLLEAVAEANTTRARTSSRRLAAVSGGSRGIPPGLTSARPANATLRHAAADPINDSALFI